MSSAQPMHLNCGAMQPGGPTDAVGSVAAATSSSAEGRVRRRAHAASRAPASVVAVGVGCQQWVTVENASIDASTSLLQPYRSIKSW